MYASRARGKTQWRARGGSGDGARQQSGHAGLWESVGERTNE